MPQGETSEFDKDETRKLMEAGIVGLDPKDLAGVSKNILEKISEKIKKYL